MSDKMPPWPKHPDGRPMTMGEMTCAQRMEQGRAAAKQLEKEWNDPKWQAQLSHLLGKQR